MSFFERLSALISEKNLTFRKVERDCGLANATIRRWETQSPRLESVIAVANYLQVSVDYLALGRSENTTSSSPVCDVAPLSQVENDVIAMFRLLPSYEREDLFDLIYFKYKKHVEKKMESIYWTYASEKGKAKPTSAPGDDSQSINA